MIIFVLCMIFFVSVMYRWIEWEKKRFLLSTTFLNRLYYEFLISIYFEHLMFLYRNRPVCSFTTNKSPSSLNPRTVVDKLWCDCVSVLETKVRIRRLPVFSLKSNISFTSCPLVTLKSTEVVLVHPNHWRI